MFVSTVSHPDDPPASSLAGGCDKILWSPEQMS
jgi:hypothetical protein